MADKLNETEIVETIKKKPRGKNIGETLAPITEPGDNTKYLSLGRKIFNLPTIDLKDPKQVMSRLDEFFAIHEEYDTKPTVAGMAMCLGINRRTLWSIANDQPSGGNGYKMILPEETTNLVKKAYEMLEMSMENYANAGKINPVMAIFMMKNHFGYQDKTEYVLTPNQKQESDYNADEISKRYLNDSATIVDAET